MAKQFDQERTLLSQMAPAGYYIALRMRFFAPETEISTLPPALMQKYCIRGLALEDPMLQWAFRNQGAICWTGLSDRDPAGVLAEYGRHGLTYGAVVSIMTHGRPPLRSFGIFARHDRIYSEAEMTRIELILGQMHRSETQILTQRQIDVLRLLAEGHRYKKIAHILGITESAVKVRLKSAALRLGARTAAQTLRMAVSAGLLQTDE